MIAAALRRALGASGAAVAGTLLAGGASGALRAPMDRVGGALREAALFAPIAGLVAAVLVPVAVFLSQPRIESWRTRLNADAATRADVGAVALLLPSAGVLWVAVVARLGRVFLTAFRHVGLAALAQAVVLAITTVAAYGAFQLARRFVRRLAAPRLASWRSAPLALVGGVALAGTIAFVGMRAGDSQGHGGVLGTFGVLRKPELDLAPVWGLAGAFIFGALGATLFSRRWWLAVGSLALGALVGGVVLRKTAMQFEASPSANVIDARPGLARTMLRLLRRRFDRDHDGQSALFGGGDCDDRDAARNSLARDVPGNGIDEDCSGRDAPPPPRPPPPPPPTVRQRLLAETPDAMNLVVITVDTLRWDLHYAGNPRELSPRLDRLAAQSVVFDHGYAISSYTGRAIVPLMTSRYPTECWRDRGHFTVYPRDNVLLGERLHDAGFRTFGAASHFYFQRRYGLAQGMDDWDMRAEPSGGEQETLSADARVADRAITQLQDPRNASQRFFSWIHFFDPHKLYVDHPEIPPFARNERGRYDAEVAWTDRQIGRVLDALDALPAAQRTIVVVTADHGEAFNEHGMSWHGIELWDELVRVPWLIRIPGVAPQHIATWRGQIDLVPTLVELLRLPPPAASARDAFSGVSLVPDLFGAPQPERPIYVELPEGPFNSMRRSVIAGGWKLTERGSRRFELYDLTHDPGEHTNLASTQPDRLAAMRALMEQVRAGLHPVAEAGGAAGE